jgi:predicted nucleotidyltransferase
MAGFFLLKIRSSAALAFGVPAGYNAVMITLQRSGPELLTLLRRHEAELRARGVEALTVFGSRARGGATEGSDVDLAVRPGPTFSTGGFDHFGKLDALRDHLATVLGCTVDLVEEGAVRPRLRQVIEREGVRAF